MHKTLLATPENNDLNLFALINVLENGKVSIS